MVVVIDMDGVPVRVVLAEAPTPPLRRQTVTAPPNGTLTPVSANEAVIVVLDVAVAVQMYVAALPDVAWDCLDVQVNPPPEMLIGLEPSPEPP